MSKLEFIIKRKNGKKDVSARLIVESDNKIKNSIIISRDALNLFDFAFNFSIENNIKFHKTKKPIRDGLIETVTFDRGKSIVNKFDRNLIIDRSKKYKLTKNIAIGTVVSAIGIFTVCSFLGKGPNTDTDTNTITTVTNTNSDIDDIIPINLGISAGFSNIFASGSDLTSLNSLSDILCNKDIDSELTPSNVDNLDFFSFNYEDRSSSETVSISKNNMETFNKYGEKYGIDPNLLMAIMSQEGSGIHKEYSENGHAIGGFQIENVWDGESLSAYNFETREMETIKVVYNELKDFDYNAKVAAMILQLCMRKFDYNVPQAVQAYNMGIGRVDGFGDDWNTKRLSCNSGDPMYVEHVFSYLHDGYFLTMKKPDGKTVNFVLDNECSNTYEATVKQ